MGRSGAVITVEEREYLLLDQLELNVILGAGYIYILVSMSFLYVVLFLLWFLIFLL